MKEEITANDVKTYDKNVESYKTDLNTKTNVQVRIDEASEGVNPTCQVSAKLRVDDKTALYALIKSKGCDGLTSFLKLLAKSERVEIKI